MLRALGDARDLERIRRSTRGIVQVPQQTVTADYAVQGTDVHVIVDAGAPLTITLPPAAEWLGRDLIVTRINATHTVTVDADGSETISGSATFAMTTQWTSLTLRGYSGGWLIV